MEAAKKPKLKLTGEDGNVFFIIGRAVKFARRAGWTEERIKTFTEEMQAGDYDHALQTCMKYFDVD